MDSLQAPEIAEYKFCPITPADSEAVLEFMYKDFLTSEPMSAMQNMTVDEASELFKTDIHICTLEPTSFMIRHASDDSIIAIYLTYRTVRPNEQASNLAPGEAYLKTFEPINQKSKNIVEIMESLEKDKWSKIPSDINCLLDGHIMSCDSKYRRAGLMTELVQYTAKKTFSLGCQGLIGKQTSCKTQQLNRKSGATIIAEIEYENWKPNGAIVFDCSNSQDKKVEMSYLLY